MPLPSREISAAITFTKGLGDADSSAAPIAVFEFGCAAPCAFVTLMLSFQATKDTNRILAGQTERL